ncbi:MAG: hypothetical protein FWE90_00785 [Defluviitaleaceae bacterium]|nr:hypothetical protein [Defluviitaleaceae bacterium]
MRKTVLISCSKLKRTYPCEARLLYDASSLFNKSLLYAKTISDEIFVLSAKYGLVSLDKQIEPYDETLKDKTSVQSSVWGHLVARQLAERFDIQRTVFVILAGKDYYQPLQAHLPQIILPLLGLSMGNRLAKLDALINQSASIKPNSICIRLHALFNKLPRYYWDTIDNIGFDNGIYILFEVGEKYHGMDRIVRIGTHRSNGRLRRRLKDHFISENKDGSIFRKNIGKAILNKNNHMYLRAWSVDTSKPENIIRLGDEYNPALQKKIEESVTEYIRNNFSFVCFPVPTEQERLRLEEGMIATLNKTPDFNASIEWRGKYSTEHEIFQSGLWLKQGLDAMTLLENEYIEIEILCTGKMPDRIISSYPKNVRENIPVQRQSMNTHIMGTNAISDFLMEKLNDAKSTEQISITIKSGDIHRELGLISRMPTVCQAMRKIMKGNDVIHYQPPKGNGATLEIEYFL